MARTLDAILQELDAGYNPSRTLINQRLDALPGQADAEIAGLQGQQTQAFNDITAGARDKGLGFSGIPLSEQARYTAGSFLPAVAKVRQSQNDVKSSLLGSLNDTNLDQRKTGMGIYQAELDRDERRAAEERAAALERQRAAASAPFDFSKLLGPPPTAAANASGGAPKPTDNIQQLAYNDVLDRINSKANDRALQSDYLATAASAKNGNQKDLFKLQTYRYLRPDLFKQAYAWESVKPIQSNNGVGLRY